MQIMTMCPHVSQKFQQQIVQKDVQESKLEQPWSVYSKQGAQQQEQSKPFKCFYCDQLCLDDRERITHMDSEHTVKLYYPRPADFEKRLDPQRQQQGAEPMTFEIEPQEYDSDVRTSKRKEM